MGQNSRLVRAVLDSLGNPLWDEDNSTNLGAAYSPRLSASDSSVMFVFNRSNGVYWQRLDFDGVPLDASPALLTTATGNENNVTVATFGDLHLIVWEDRRLSATNGVDIYGTLIRDDGEAGSRATRSRSWSAPMIKPSPRSRRRRRADRRGTNEDPTIGLLRKRSRRNSGA